MVSLDKNVGDALLRLDLAPSIGSARSAQIERIIDEDRRRVKRWTRISITLWIIAAVGAMVYFRHGWTRVSADRQIGWRKTCRDRALQAASGKRDADKTVETA